MGLCFIWVFSAHPTVDAATSFSNGAGWNPILRLLAVGLIPGVLLPFFRKWLIAPDVRFWAFLFCCVLRTFGNLIESVAGDFEVLSFLSTFLSGSGAGVCLVLWGLTLWSFEAERNERVFVCTFVLTGATGAALGLLPQDAIAFLLIMFPLAECGFWWICQKQIGTSRVMSSQSVGEVKSSLDWPMLVRICLAVTVVSLVWEMFSSSAWCSELPKLSIFGSGLIAAALFVLAFTKLSPSMGFNAAAQWALPVMALGLFFAGVDSPEGILMECLLLSVSHASFETVLRMRIISGAQEKGIEPIGSIGWGYAAIMLGAFLGPVVFHLLVELGVEVSRLFLMGLLTFLVVASAFMFPGERKNGDAGFVALDIQDRCRLLSSRFGLTPREAEVLGYLLEGRSYPYIRDRLYISQSTVNTHVRHIYSKAGVNSKQDLIDLSMNL